MTALDVNLDLSDRSGTWRNNLQQLESQFFENRIDLIQACAKDVEELQKHISERL